jgi:hypothetical protein
MKRLIFFNLFALNFSICFHLFDNVFSVLYNNCFDIRVVYKLEVKCLSLIEMSPRHMLRRAEETEKILSLNSR